MKKLQHIIEYILFLFFGKILRLLSVDNAASLCSLIARFIGPHLKVTDIARKNLKKIYGEKINLEEKIAGLWDNFGRYMGEFPFINALDQTELDKRITFSGLDKISIFQENKQPFLLFLCHQANWDFVIPKINLLYPKFAIAYRKANNPYIDKAVLKKRENGLNIKMVAKGTHGAKDLVRAIKAGFSIAMLVDQKMNNGIEVPFFDMPAMTAPAIAKLGLQYKYPIVPAQIIRRGKSSYFDIIIHDPIQTENLENTEKNCYEIMCNINKIIEEWINQAPQQWFWFHNRWKN